MQNIFIVPGMQHGCRAEPLLKVGNVGWSGLCLGYRGENPDYHSLRD